MLEIAYGRTITIHDEFFVNLASNATLQVTAAGSPSASLVDFIPIRESSQCRVISIRMHTHSPPAPSAPHAHLASMERMETEGTRGTRADARSNDSPL